MEQAAHVERIKEMEEALDRATEAVRQLARDLDCFETSQPAISKLAAYYGSEEWFEDRDADEDGELPTDLKRGVLGEDVPYDLLVEYRDLAIRMLETATRMLKE